jgi:uncharacterized protein YycO
MTRQNDNWQGTPSIACHYDHACLCLAVLCLCIQVVVTDNPAVLHASNIHFGQYGLLVPVLRDPAALAIQAAEWACGQVGAWYGYQFMI